MKDLVKAIQACAYLDFCAVLEPEQNSQRLVICEAKVGNPISAAELEAEPNSAVRDLLAGSERIVQERVCQVFQLTWASYVGYSIENESFGLPEPQESMGEGRSMVTYTHSRHLTYLSKATFASSGYPGPFKHWAVHCLNHIVHVASLDEPSITASTRLDSSFQ